VKLPIPVRLQAQSKYRAVRTEVDGIVFASKREANAYAQFKMLKDSGHYECLELQVRYPLVVNGKLICTYVADFVVLKRGATQPEVWDAKGFRTREYVIKRKLFEALMGLTIHEI
jgi:hypothetical protein